MFLCSYHVMYGFQNYLLETGTKSEVLVTATRLEPATAMNSNPLSSQSFIKSYAMWIHSETRTCRDRTYSQMHRTDKYSQHSTIILPVWLNGRVFVYELSGCGFESSFSHLNFRFRACFQQGVPWHSDNYRVWIHSETRTWHDKNIQSNVPYR